MSDSKSLSGLPAIESGQFWRVLSGRASAVAVVASANNGVPAGFLALSVTHLTADPPTITVSIGKSTSALETVLQAGAFAVNYLRKSDSALADIFSGKTGHKGESRFEAGKWGSMATGAPVYNNALLALDCVLEEAITRHDTILVLARIVDFADSGDNAPLLHFRGKYQ
jgi:flavin reductase (DIM6/NTAB) family NADH-FMN oxidoreductase RutF